MPLALRLSDMLDRTPWHKPSEIGVRKSKEGDEVARHTEPEHNLKARLVGLVAQCLLHEQATRPPTEKAKSVQGLFADTPGSAASS